MDEYVWQTSLWMGSNNGLLWALLTMLDCNLTFPNLSQFGCLCGST